jgi:EmrB/QacA subfamily drug resistance transporter
MVNNRVGWKSRTDNPLTRKGPTNLNNQNQGLHSLPRKMVITTFAGVILAMFLSSLDQTIVSTAMPKVIADLGGFSHYTWVTTAYLIASTVVVPITGKLTDIYGRKWFYIAGIVIFMIGSLLSGLSQSMLQLILFRGFQGIGAGIMMANAFTVIGDLFPPAERGKYQGFTTGTFGLSSIIGPTLGGFITDRFSWHWVFLINIPLAILIIILFIIFFPQLKPAAAKRRIDWAGITTLVLTVVPIMLALTWGGVEFPWFSFQIIAIFVFSLIMFFSFIAIERRSPEAIIPLTLFSNRIVSVSFAINFLTGMCMFGGIIFIPLFFQGVLGLSATASGSFLTPMMLGQVSGSLISGQLLSRAGGHYRIHGIIGVAIMAVGLFLLSRMTLETTYTAAVINIVIMGFGLGITMPLYTIAVQNAVPYSILGAATSSVAFFRSIGGTFGLAVFGTIMTNSFASNFLAKIPDLVKSAIPAPTLSSMANNPQALVSVDAQTQLKNLLTPLGEQGLAAFNQILQVMRQSLSQALTHVFLIALAIAIVAFILNFFLREIPLRKKFAAPPEDKPADH